MSLPQVERRSVPLRRRAVADRDRPLPDTFDRIGHRLLGDGIVAAAAGLHDEERGEGGNEGEQGS